MVYPIENRVLVHPDSPVKKSSGGLLLAVVDKEKQYRGTIVKVGDGERVQRFKEGEALIYQRYGPAHVKVDGVEMVIVHIDEILGTDKEETK